jgi:hypothetical protein
MVEFGVREFGVKPKAGWVARLEEARARWRLLQVKSAIRDVIREGPDHIPDELKEAVNDGWRAVTGHGRA